MHGLHDRPGVCAIPRLISIDERLIGPRGTTIRNDPCDRTWQICEIIAAQLRQTNYHAIDY